MNQQLWKNPNLHIIFGVTLIAVLGVASVAPALPSIIDALGISPDQVGLLITAFTVPGVILMPVIGLLADRYGRKRILGPSLLLFAVAGFACGFARDFETLLLLRLVQGTGGASLGMLNITIIGDTFAGRERPAALGLNASVLSVAVAVYPVLGGALATLGWYMPFFLPILALPVGWAVLYRLRSPEPEGAQPLGQYLRRTLRGLGRRQALGCVLATLAVFIIIYGPFLTFLPVHLGKNLAAPPFVIGLILAVPSVVTALVSAQMGRIAALASTRVRVAFAFSVHVAAGVLFARMGAVWAFVLPAALHGLANGIAIPSLQALLADLAPIDQRAGFMAANGMMLRLGQTLGPLLMGVAFGLWGMGGVFYAGAAVAAATVFLGLFTRGMPQRAGGGDEDAP